MLQSWFGKKKSIFSRLRDWRDTKDQGEGPVMMSCDEVSRRQEAPVEKAPPAEEAALPPALETPEVELTQADIEEEPTLEEEEPTDFPTPFEVVPQARHEYEAALSDLSDLNEPSARSAVPLSARDSIHEGDMFQLETSASGRYRAVPVPVQRLNAADEARALMESGIQRISDNLSRISTSLEEQHESSDEMLGHLETLPAALQAAGESAKKLDLIRREIEKQNFAANEVALSIRALPLIYDCVQNLPKAAGSQLGLLDSIDRKIARYVETGQQMLEQFVEMNRTMHAVGHILDGQHQQITNFERHLDRQLDSFSESHKETVAAFEEGQSRVVGAFQEALSTKQERLEKHLAASHKDQKTTLEEFHQGQAQALEAFRAQQSRQLKSFHSTNKKAVTQVVGNQRQTMRRMELERSQNERRAFRFAVAAGLMFLVTVATLLSFGLKGHFDGQATLAQQSKMERQIERLTTALAREKELDNAERGRIDAFAHTPTPPGARSGR